MTDVEFTIPIGQSTVAVAVAGVDVVSQPAGLVACTQHRGDYRDIGAAYRALDDWIRTSRYRAAGAPTEVYLVGPNETAHTRDLFTEIRMPVTRCSP